MRRLTGSWFLYLFFAAIMTACACDNGDDAPTEIDEATSAPRPGAECPEVTQEACESSFPCKECQKCPDPEVADGDDEDGDDDELSLEEKLDLNTAMVRFQLDHPDGCPATPADNDNEIERFEGEKKVLEGIVKNAEAMPRDGQVEALTFTVEKLQYAETLTENSGFVGYNEEGHPFCDESSGPGEDLTFEGAFDGSMRQMILHQVERFTTIAGQHRDGEGNPDPDQVIDAIDHFINGMHDADTEGHAPGVLLHGINELVDLDGDDFEETNTNEIILRELAAFMANPKVARILGEYVMPSIDRVPIDEQLINRLIPDGYRKDTHAWMTAMWDALQADHKKLVPELYNMADEVDDDGKLVEDGFKRGQERTDKERLAVIKHDDGTIDEHWLTGVFVRRCAAAAQGVDKDGNPVFWAGPARCDKLMRELTWSFLLAARRTGHPDAVKWGKVVVVSWQDGTKAEQSLAKLVREYVVKDPAPKVEPKDGQEL